MFEPTKLPLDYITKKRDDAKTALDKARPARQRAEKAISKKEGQIADVKGRKVKTAEQKRNKVRDLDAAQKDLRALKAEHKKQLAIERKQRAAYETYEKERIQAVRFQREITKQEQLADTAASEMRTADGKDDEGAYDKAKDKRSKALKSLRELLARARAKLADQDSEAARELDKTIASTDDDIQSTSTSESEASSREPDEPELTDVQKKLLAGDQKNIALAALTKGLDDDKAGAGKLVDDLQGILNSLTSGAQPASDDLITDVAGQLKTARDNFESITTGKGNDNPDLQAQIDQANERNRVLAEESRLNRQALEVFGGSGDIGAGGRSAVQAAAPNYHITLSSFVPPNEQQATQAAGWIVSGIDNQGARQSPRQAVGKWLIVGASSRSAATASRPLHDFDNKILYPSFESGATTGWFVANAAGVVAGTFAPTTGWSSDGDWSLRVSGTNAADTTSRAIGVRTATGTAGMPVDPGEVVNAGAALNVVSAASQGFRYAINWYKADGSPSSITASVAGSLVGANATGIVSLALSAAAPADAAFFAAHIQALVNTASDFVDFYVDAVFAGNQTSYAAGNTPGWGWRGPAHASASASLIETIKDVDNNTDLFFVEGSFQFKTGDRVTSMAAGPQRYAGERPARTASPTARSHGPP